MLALQGNPSGREADRPQVFQAAIANDFADVKHEVVTSTEKGHGRLDERACHMIEIPTAHPRRCRCRADWPGLRTRAVIVSRREGAGEEGGESRLDIRRPPPKPSRWRTPSANTGRSKTARMGYSTSRSTRARAANKTATAVPTSPPSAA